MQGLEYGIILVWILVAVEAFLITAIIALA